MLRSLSKLVYREELIGCYSRKHYLILAIFTIAAISLRFWGLGNVGLHGDEETMAMPTLSILSNGLPYLPSGMLYPRGLPQLYLMAASVSIFGESEWALRLPSVIFGSLAPIFAFFLGRRFLTPSFNLAFVAVIAAFPLLIEVSQTARMYVFLVTCLIAFGVWICRWERTDKLIDLLAAFLIVLLALAFHRLAIFAAPIYLFPGLAQQSWRKFVAGLSAFGFTLAIFFGHAQWVKGHYPENPGLDPEAELRISAPLSLLAESSYFIAGVTALIVVGLFLAMVGVRRFDAMVPKVPMAIVTLGIIAAGFLHYHIAAIVILFGVVAWLRSNRRSVPLLLVLLTGVGVLALMQVIVLSRSGEFPGRSLVGAMIGQPSVWPLIRIALYNQFAAIAYIVSIAYGICLVIRSKPIADHYLFFLVAVYGPLWIMGIMTWDIPARYTLGILPFFLLSCLAGIQQLFHKVLLTGRWRNSQFAASALLVAVTLAMIGPLSVFSVVHSGYERHPDHKGAAEFIKQLRIAPDDVLIAEDVLQQTYYLGEVDYWLLNIDVAAAFSVLQNDELVDQYTHTRVLGTGKDLEEVLSMQKNNDVYIIGSGELFADRRALMRAHGIQEVLQSELLQEVFLGADKKTRIWKLRR